jgi:hypothetical protein
MLKEKSSFAPFLTTKMVVFGVNKFHAIREV